CVAAVRGNIEIPSTGVPGIVEQIRAGTWHFLRRCRHQHRQQREANLRDDVSHLVVSHLRLSNDIKVLPPDVCWLFSGLASEPDHPAPADSMSRDSPDERRFSELVELTY